MSATVPQVDFYLLGDQQIPPRLVYNLAGKARAQGYGVHIQAGDEAAARQLDDGLWTFKDISFLPHGLMDEAADDEADAAETPITIGWPGTALRQTEVLINLAPDLAEPHAGYERILELVSTDTAARQRARERYRRYRQAGARLNTHELDQAHG